MPLSHNGTRLLLNDKRQIVIVTAVTTAILLDAVGNDLFRLSHKVGIASFQIVQQNFDKDGNFFAPFPSDGR